MRDAALAAVASLLEGVTAESRGTQTKPEAVGSAEPAAEASSPVPRCRASSHRVASRSGTATFVTRAERSVAEHGGGCVARVRRARPRTRCGAGAAPPPRRHGPGRRRARSSRRTWSCSTIRSSSPPRQNRIARGRSAGFAWRSALRASMAALRRPGGRAACASALTICCDLEAQVLAALAGEEGDTAITLPEAAIVLADELLPSQLIALDARRIAGIGTARGGPTSHVAILAAAMGNADAGRGRPCDSRDRGGHAPVARRRAAATCRSNRRATRSPRPSASSAQRDAREAARARAAQMPA